MKIWLFFLKLFVVSALLIISNSNLHLYESNSREVFLEEYTAWLSEIFDQGVYITGYVVKADWLPNSNTENNTISLPHR